MSTSTVTVQIMTHEFIRHIRDAITRADRHAEMYRIGSALIFAEQTTRPAFRELIDHLQWGDIR